MKRTMRKVSSIFLTVIFAVCLLSCGSDSTTQDLSSSSQVIMANDIPETNQPEEADEVSDNEYILVKESKMKVWDDGETVDSWIDSWTDYTYENDYKTELREYYNSTGYLRETTLLEYNDNGDLVKEENCITNSDTTGIYYEYNEAGQLLSEEQYTNGEFDEGHYYTYDEAGRILTDVTTDNGNLDDYTYEYQFDDNGDVVSYTVTTGKDRDGGWRIFYYDSNGVNLLTETYQADGLDWWSEQEIDEDGNIISETWMTEYGIWKQFAYTYDEDGFCTSYICTDYYRGTNPEVKSYYEYSREYDEQGNLIMEQTVDMLSEYSGESLRTNYVYDEDGNLIEEVTCSRPQSNEYSAYDTKKIYEYDENGYVTMMTVYYYVWEVGFTLDHEIIYEYEQK